MVTLSFNRYYPIPITRMMTINIICLILYKTVFDAIPEIYIRNDFYFEILTTNAFI